MEKITIGICDDDKQIRETIENMCSTILQQKFLDYEVLQFENGEQFLLYGGTVDILILDIEMPEKNGIEIKNQLQAINSRTMIIFVTNHDELVFSAFGLQVFGMVIKNRLDEHFADMFRAAVQTMNQYVLIDGMIDSRDVLFIRSERVYNNLMLVDGTNKLIRASLSELEQQLSTVGFIRVHRTYLINPKWVEQLDVRSVIVKGNLIPVSARKQREVMEKYRKYCEKNAGYL